jgi:hypothetical protein
VIQGARWISNRGSAIRKKTALSNTAERRIKLSRRTKVVKRLLYLLALQKRSRRIDLAAETVFRSMTATTRSLVGGDDKVKADEISVVCTLRSHKGADERTRACVGMQ